MKKEVLKAVVIFVTVFVFVIMVRGVVKREHRVEINDQNAGKLYMLTSGPMPVISTGVDQVPAATTGSVDYPTDDDVRRWALEEGQGWEDGK